MENRSVYPLNNIPYPSFLVGWYLLRKAWRDGRHPQSNVVLVDWLSPTQVTTFQPSSTLNSFQAYCITEAEKSSTDVVEILYWSKWISCCHDIQFTQHIVWAGRRSIRGTGTNALFIRIYWHLCQWTSCQKKYNHDLLLFIIALFTFCYLFLSFTDLYSYLCSCFPK